MKRRVQLTGWAVVVVGFFGSLAIGYIPLGIIAVGIGGGIVVAGLVIDGARCG